MIYGFRLVGASDQLSGPLILRAYREGYARPGQARFEAAVQNAIAGLGYPAARVFITCPQADVLGTPFIVMERLPGTIMLQGTGELDEQGQIHFRRYQFLLQAPKLTLSIPRLCAQAQVRLHSLDPEAVVRAFAAEGLPTDALTFAYRLDDLKQRVGDDKLASLARAVTWLVEHQPTPPAQLAICHGDTQPNNLLLTGGEITGVIDWSQALVTDPAFDVGYTKVAFETAPLHLPKLVQWTARPIGRWLARRFVRTYSRSRHVNAQAVEYYGTFRCVLALAYIGSRRLAGRSEPDVWDSPAGIRNLIARVRSTTGIEVRLPEDTRAPIG